MSPEMKDARAALLGLIHAARDPAVERPFVLGLCGAQGSGKSTLAAAIARDLADAGLTAAVLSLDDLYLGKEERKRRAAALHPLLATRGVPGTHDVELGVELLRKLGRPGRVRLPCFDKATDTIAPHDRWAAIEGPVDVVVLEGWCVGALPEDDRALDHPVNDLEREADPDGAWRRFVNTSLSGAYRALFDRIDRLVLLAAPDFEIVYAWRIEQEQTLRSQLAAAGRSVQTTLCDDDIGRFIRHFERLTRHISSEMPHRADLVIRLDPARTIVAVEAKASDR